MVSVQDALGLLLRRCPQPQIWAPLVTTVMGQLYSEQVSLERVRAMMR